MFPATLTSRFVIIVFIISQFVVSLPIMRLKLCVASNNQYRLQNQCVHCHNKQFSRTVRLCTGVPYLPANVSIEEGYCIIRQCRTQMPAVRPEPFFGGPGMNTINVNTQDGGGYDEGAYMSSADQPQLQAPIPFPKPMRRRPAHVFVGQPLRPMRPSLFGPFGRKRRAAVIEDYPDTPTTISSTVSAIDFRQYYHDLSRGRRVTLVADDGVL